MAKAPQICLALMNVIPTVAGEKWVDGAFNGMTRAVRETAWSKSSSRHIVLIGDSSSYAREDPKNTFGGDEIVIRSEAEQSRIRIVSVLLLNTKVEVDHARSRSQFQTLSDNRRVGSFGYHFTEETVDFASEVSIADSYVYAIEREMTAIIVNRPL